MKKYPKYKDSGVEWIGEIPEHWNCIKIGYFSKLITGFPFKSEEFDFEEGIKVVRGDNITEGNLRWGEKTRYWKEITDDLEGVMLQENDIVVGMDGSKVGKNYSIIKQSDLPLLLVQRVCRIRITNDVNPILVLFQIGSDYFRHYINVLKTDPMIPHITQKNIFDFPIIIPPVPEQPQIVEFLDKKTSIIDDLIQKKQRKIELLKEHRTSIINHTVTKGLNPDVKMKDSGVEWIGEIPEHWELRRINTLGGFSKGGGIRKDEIIPSGLPCIRYGEIYTQYDRIVYSPVSCISKESSLQCESIKKGDVLFTGSGETMEDIGKCVVYFGDDEVFVGGDVIILKLKEGIMLLPFVRTEKLKNIVV